MIVFRLSKSAFSNDLSGKGAELSGGRWNSKGVAMIYTSHSRALCATEIAVHSGLGLLPRGYQLISIEIPDDIEMQAIEPGQLPVKWKSFPHSHSTQQLGNQFVSAKQFLVLKVPSAVIQGDFNYLINPHHPQIEKIKIVAIEDFNFDERLFVK